MAFDARTGQILWEFRPRGVSATPGNPQVTTASPVADPERRFIYTASPNGVIYTLSVAGGRQVWSRSITFDPANEKIASALNVSGDRVVAVTGGHQNPRRQRDLGSRRRRHRARLGPDPHRHR